VNCLLGEAKFRSEESSESVTRDLEFTTKEDDKRKFVVYNIPGLLEDDETRVQANVEILQKAFADSNSSLVFYVLTTEGGRVRSNDAEAYKALAKAYTMSDKSFTFIVNKWKRKTITEGDVAHRIKSVLEDREVLFIPELDGDFKKDCEKIRPILFVQIEKMTPVEVKKKDDLHLQAAEVKKLKEELKQQLATYERKIKEDSEKARREIEELNKKVQEEQKRQELLRKEIEEEQQRQRKMRREFEEDQRKRKEEFEEERRRVEQQRQKRKRREEEKEEEFRQKQQKLIEEEQRYKETFETEQRKRQEEFDKKGKEESTVDRVLTGIATLGISELVRLFR